jgi:hypothetical protein
MGKAISRTFRNGDEDKLVELYNLVTGRSRTIEQYKWEWLNTPEGQGSIWVLEWEDNNRKEVVGHHGLIPIRFNYFGQPMLVGKTENTMVHPGYRKKIIYFKYEEKFVEETRKRFDLLYTTAGSGVIGKIRRQLGYSIVGGYAQYVKVINVKSFSKMIATAVNKRIHNKIVASLITGVSKLFVPVVFLFFCRKGEIDKTIDLEKITDIEEASGKLDDFWRRNKGNFGITVDRNSRYLKWRIFDNPNLGYEFFIAKKDSKIIGYAITKIGQGEYGTIVDLIAEGDNNKIFDTILDMAVDKFQERGICVIYFPTLLSKNFLNKRLRRNGFIPFSEIIRTMKKITGGKDQVLMVKVLNNELEPQKVSKAACWYFTDILTEGIR